jgi:hypothetical protein
VRKRSACAWRPKYERRGPEVDRESEPRSPISYGQYEGEVWASGKKVGFIYTRTSHVYYSARGSIEAGQE